MLVSCWSTKGGTGTTVVAAALALLLARATGSALAADLAGDLPVALGLPPTADRPGLAEWLAAAPDVPADALARMEDDVGGGLALVRRGPGPLGHGPPAALLAGMLAAEERPVVVDCGRLAAVGAGSPDDVRVELAGAADRSLLVVRPCFLAVRGAAAAPVRATGLVLVCEEGRVLDAADVEHALGLPVVARVRVTDAIARAVDAGLLATRLPRSLADDLRHAA